MKTKDFFFELPEHLIAQHPSAERGASRLMVLNTHQCSVHHKMISDLVDILPADAILVVNNSKVRRARLQAHTSNGGSVEVLLLRETGGQWEAMLSRSKKRKINELLQLPGGVQLELLQRNKTGTWQVQSDQQIDDKYLDMFGSLPLPPYIKRADTAFDAERYQTVYAAETGSVAAPTAGLHFTPQILAGLTERGIELHEITLHVGLGTFLPVRAENITDHSMHREEYSIHEHTAQSITAARRSGRPVIAVGTTSLRALESSWKNGCLQAGHNSTDIFIYPGYHFKTIDMLLTNFHTPESTLLMLVAALAGKECIFSAYRQAVENNYRFFSYGDAMLINTLSHP